MQTAIEHIYPLVYEFRKERSVEEQFALENKKRKLIFKLHEPVIDDDIENKEFPVDNDESENSDSSWS